MLGPTDNLAGRRALGFGAPPMTDRDSASPTTPAKAERLELEVRVLRERLAFYEGFDRLIQDNVAHARELFRLAAQEREAASAEIEREKREAAKLEARLKAELQSVALEVGELGRVIDTLSRRIAAALGEMGGAEVTNASNMAGDARSFAVVAHGVSSASRALSLQRFVASLPQVTEVQAREFAGGVLRLDARVRDPLAVDLFRRWEPERQIQPLTERPDVVEFTLGSTSG